MNLRHQWIRDLAGACGLMAALWLAAAPLCVGGPAPALPGSGQVRVNTDPSGAVVAVDGDVREAAPTLISGLPPGEHLLCAAKAGYREARRTITLAPGQRMAVDLALEPLVGLVLLQSSPTGAEVRIDGADRGRTPLLITDIPLGKYRLTFSGQGCVPKDVELQVANRTPILLSVPLTTDSANLVLDSTPSGADVTMDGVSRGTTPCTLERIPSGAHKLEVNLAGYEPFVRDLSLAAAQSETLKAALKPIPAHLTVVSVPPGARVYFNEQFRGQSPVTVEQLDPAAYVVRSELAGYETLARTVTVERASKGVEEFRLVSNSGALELTTEPAGVKVFIDGKEAGVTVAKASETDQVSEPWQTNLLAAGSHKVQLSKKGHFAKTITVEIKPQQTTTVHDSLKKRFIADYEVTTADTVFRGVLQEKDPQGNIKLEIKPGIIQTIPAATVVTAKPLREEKE